MAIKVCEKSIDFIAKRYNQQSPEVRAYQPDPPMEKVDRRLHSIVALNGGDGAARVTSVSELRDR